MTSQTADGAYIVAVLRIRVATTQHQGHRAAYGAESLPEFQTEKDDWKEKTEQRRSRKMTDVA